MHNPNGAPGAVDLAHGLNQLHDVIRYIERLPGENCDLPMLAVLALIQKAGISLERGATAAGMDCPVVGNAEQWMRSGTTGAC